MKFALLMLGIVALLLVGCAQSTDAADTDDPMANMPCHQMPDGSWMGDCGDEEMEMQSESPCGDNVGHMHDEDEPCGLNHDHPTVELPAGAQRVTELSELTAEKVIGKIGGKNYQFYGYNGVIPGPTLFAKQGDEFQITFTNEIDMPTTVHWHGLRHDNKDDGVPGVTQNITMPGESHEYTIKLPDYGAYWYHPHVREDMQQDLGLSGLIVVEPAEDIYNSVDREEVLVFDDLLVSQNGPVGYGDEATYTLMGRFGNVMLVNGKVDYHIDAKAGETIRFYLANVANVRPFNISFEGAQMKRVGGDMSLYQEETFEDSVILAPAERVIVEVLFAEAGDYQITHKSPHGEAHLGEVIVRGESEHGYQSLSLNPLDRTDIVEYEQYFDNPIDHTIVLDIEMEGMHMMESMGGMPCHQMPDGSWMGDCEGVEEADHSMSGGIEWEDEMAMMNAMSTSETVTWIIRDNETQAENMAVNYQWKVGDKVKLRIVNDGDSMHPMQHPFHIHGQRFVVTHIDGEPVENKVWKDTVLIPAGHTYDILLDVTNPGKWMMHCHIAEHLEAGMMANFEVTV